jgi:hypothetical protein
MTLDSLLTEAQPLAQQRVAMQIATMHEEQHIVLRRRSALFQALRRQVGPDHADLLALAHLRNEQPNVVAVIDLARHGYGVVEIEMMQTDAGWVPVGAQPYRVPACYGFVRDGQDAFVIAGHRVMTDSLVEAVALAIVAGPSRFTAMMAVLQVGDVEQEGRES